MTKSERPPASIAARLIVESMAEIVKGRSATLDLDEVCTRLGITTDDVRGRRVLNTPGD
jgi:hypothetical protein